MAELPRTRCPRCGRWVPVRRNGALREHYYEANGKCEASGEIPPATFAASPMRVCLEHDRSEAECRRLALEDFGQPAFDNCEFAGEPAHTEEAQR